MKQKHLLKSMLLLLALIVGSNAWADTETITLSEQGYSNAEQVSSTSGTVVTLTYTDGGTPTAYYNTGTGVRVYNGGKMTVTAGNNTITKVVVTFGKNNSPTISFSSNGTNTKTSTDSPATWEGNATSVDFNVSSSGHARIQIVEVTYDVPSTSTLASIALSGEYPTSFFVGDAFSHEGMTVTATYEDETSKDVTSKAQFSGYDMTTVSSSQTVTVSYTEGEVTQTASYQIEVKAVPTHEVTWSVNGTTSSESYQEGANITFPANPADIEGKTFVGWVTEAITGTTDEAPTFVTSATMGTEALTFYAVFAEKTPGTQTTVTDVLTSAITGVTGTGSYSDWSDKTVTSDAVYAGNSAKSSINAIQMHSTNSNSGIISTTSGGILKSVTVTWTDGNTSGRSLDIYGSNTAYSKATDLYDSKKQGTKLGSITYGTSTSLTISGDYTYVGLRSNNGALYLADISIEWTAGTPDTYSAYCTTVAADNRKEAGISFAEATVTKEIVDNYTGQVLSNPNNVSPITWTSSNEAVATVENGTVTVIAVGETTIKASFAGDETYKKAEVSYTLTVQDSRQAINLSFAETSVTVNISETVDAPTLNGNTGNGAVTYESSNTDIATVDVSGVVTGVAVGTATITATVAATNEHLGGTATFTVKVVNPNANDGSSIEKAFTVAEAIDVIKALPNNDATTEKYYIKGIVSSFQKTSIVGDGTNYRYFISDDGKTTTELQVFKGKGLNEATFTDADDLLVGDEVVIYGPIQYYKGNTPEIAEGNYLVSWNRPADTTPSITVDPATVDVDADVHDGTLDLTYANLTITDMSDFDIQYYDAEGEETDEPDWIEVTVAEQDPQVGEGYVVSYYMVENDGEARTAYFKVYAMDDESNLVYSNLITVTQAEYVAPEVGAAVSFDFSTNIFGMPEGSNNKTVDATDYTYGGYTINVEGSTGEGYYWHTSGYLIMGKKGASLTFPTFDFNVSKIKVYGRSGASSNVTFNLFVGEDAVSTEATSSTVDHEFLIAADKQAAGTVYTFKVTGNANAQITKIEIFGYVNATVTDAGYATYCSTKALDFTSVEGLTAYKATIAADNNISFSKVEQVPANEGVLLKGAGTFNVPVIATAEAIENIFIGVTEPKTEDPGIFVLMDGDKGVGFYKTKNTFTVGAHTAYLPASVGARNFIALDEATAINGIAAEKVSNGEIYNLQGQRVVKAQKGLYIVNGRLQVVK